MSQSCFHCGQAIDKEIVTLDNKLFCCQGCKTVYEILQQNDLADYYELNKNPGIQPDKKSNVQFQFLDTPTIFDKVVDFNDSGVVVVTFHIPVIHCSSCVWVLESLNEINPAITQSIVDFGPRKVQIAYHSNQLKLSELAQFLSDLGYKPAINLESTEKTKKKTDRRLLLQLAVAGFCFGNIMLFAFPEYVDNGDSWLAANNHYFRWWMLILSLPVLLYSAQDYLISAYKAIKNKMINIDVPIAVGILALFTRSVYEVVADISAGYFDSLAALIFFMLIGKWFQRRTYESLAFDRNYKSFYPIAVTKISRDGIQENILLSELKKGDRILLRDEEILPADAILIKGEAQIDNSFVTGESHPIKKSTGDKIFAGGKQTGAAVEVEIIEDVNQSYLTRLWNHEAFSKTETDFDTLINRVSRYFVWIVLVIAVLSAMYWYRIDVAKMFQVIAAILIIACPCALGLSAPFTLGNVMRIMGRKKLFVKDAPTIERMASVTSIVLDKTGTISEAQSADINWIGSELNEEQKTSIYTLAHQSNHPLSRGIQQYFSNLTLNKIEEYQQEKGKGQTGLVNGKKVQLGSAEWLNLNNNKDHKSTEVWVAIDNQVLGKFEFHNKYRKNLKQTISELRSYPMYLLSGDNSSEEPVLRDIFPAKTPMIFEQSPQQKLNFIQNLQVKDQQKVMMIGDGLNDAGALKQSDVGIAVAEDMNSFSPSCDAILGSDSFQLLPKFLKLSKRAVLLVKIAFAISFLYNIIGLSFAVTGNLEPVVAAILMPISSVSVVLFATLSSWLAAYYIFDKNLN